MKRRLLVALLLLSLALPGCRFGGLLARVAVTTAVVAAHVALHAAAWYAITRPIVVHSGEYRTNIRPGARVYIISRSADGRWYWVRTEAGRRGWVRADSLQGARRY